MEMFEYDSRIGAVAEATIQRCPTCGHLLSAAQGPDALCIRCEPDREPASARHASRASTIPQPHLHPPVRTSTTPSSTSALFDSISSIASSRPPSFMDSASEAEPDTEELEDHAELQARIHELEALLHQAEQTLTPEEFAVFQNEKFSSISVITPSGEQLLSSSDSMSSDGDAYSDISPDEDKTMEMWSSEPLEQPSGLLFSVTPSAIPSLPEQSIQVPEARSLEDLHDPIIPKDDLSYEPPEEVVSHIIDTYCAHAAVFNFYKPVYLFRSQLQHARALGLSTSHPDAPHPLLMNTVYLLGTHFSHRRQSEYDAARDGALCFTRLEELFLARSMRLANEQSSIEGGDRALDFCMALCNLARFFMYTKRFDLGIQFTNSSMAFAVGCGLHQIDVRPMVASSPIFASHASSPLSPTPTLPPPRSEQDVINRIRLWHSVFIVERGASSTSGLAPHLADEDILTPWPTRSLTLGPRIDEMRHHISLVERGLPLEIPFCPGSFPALVLPSQTESLFSTTGKYTAARVIAGDTSLSLRTKGMAFLERATYLAVRTSAGDFSSHSPSNSATADGPAIPGNEMMRPPASIGDCAPIDTSRLRNDFFQKFNDLDLALNTFHESLPPLRPEDFSTEVSTGPKVGADCGCDIDSSEEEFYDMEGGWAPIRSARTHSLVATNLLVLGATIQLHSILSESRPESHEAMLRAAMRVCELTAIISQQNPRNIILGGTLSMFISGRVIIREFQHVHDPTLSRGSPVSHNHEPQVLEHMLDAFRGMMKGYRQILDFYEVIIVLASLPWLHSTDVYPDSLVADLEKLGLRL